MMKPPPRILKTLSPSCSPNISTNDGPWARHPLQHQRRGEPGDGSERRAVEDRCSSSGSGGDAGEQKGEGLRAHDEGYLFRRPCLHCASFSGQRLGSRRCPAPRVDCSHAVGQPQSAWRSCLTLEWSSQSSRLLKVKRTPVLRQLVTHPYFLAYSSSGAENDRRADPRSRYH